jgi:hypothetical protein
MSEEFVPVVEPTDSEYKAYLAEKKAKEDAARAAALATQDADFAAWQQEKAKKREQEAAEQEEAEKRKDPEYRLGVMEANFTKLLHKLGMHEFFSE